MVAEVANAASVVTATTVVDAMIEADVAAMADEVDETVTAVVETVDAATATEAIVPNREPMPLSRSRSRTSSTARSHEISAISVRATTVRVVAAESH